MNDSSLSAILQMPKKRKSQDEKDLEQLAKRLLSMPHKPREESRVGKKKDKPLKRVTPCRKPDRP
jgi:hypothetical protein